MSIAIRSYQAGDARDIAELYNRFPDNPNPVAGGVTAAQLERELAGRGTAAFFLAVDGTDVVGTFGLFTTSGRRTARAGELIADMFFVAPSYRNGMVTGRLFTEVVEWMVRSGCLVLRLTVNPANTAAFTLYRRVGCVSVGDTVPGEDGNVELHNFIPLILRGVHRHLDGEVLAALAGLRSFGDVAGGRDDELRSDAVVVDGARTVTYRLVLGDHRLTALVDVDRGTLERVDVTGPDGQVRPLRITPPRYPAPVRPTGPVHRLGSPGFTCEVDQVDGTVAVFADGRPEPVFTSTWPSVHPDRQAGWRESQPCELEITPQRSCVRIVERHDGVELAGTVSFVAGTLRQTFRSGAPLRRIFATIGLRRGALTLRDTAAGTVEHHPIGLGLGIRDSSELVAAARVVPADRSLTWTDAAVNVQVPPSDHATGLVHSCLLDRGSAVTPEIETPEPGTTELRTVFRTRPGAAARSGTRPAACGIPAAGEHVVRTRAEAGGVTRWTVGAAKVLRSPHPRRGAFACNPHWSAGMWLTAERSRHSRGSGLGWGLSGIDWELKHPLGLIASDHRLDWELIVPDGPAAPVLVDVHAPDVAEESVLWLTPHTAPDAEVLVLDRPTHRTTAGRFRQLWGTAVAVRLANGSWLDCRPAAGGPHGAEIVVRATGSGLLLGCATHAVPDAGASNTWQFTVLDGSAH